MASFVGGLGSKRVCRVLLKNTITGRDKPVGMIFDYFRTTAGATDDKVALAASFLAGPYAAMLAAWNIQVTLGTLYLRYIDDALDPFRVIPLAGVGAIATDRMPTNVAVTMQLNTPVRGKMFRGAKRFYGINEIDTTADLLVAGLARWQAVQTAILLPLAAGAESYSLAVVTQSPKIIPSTQIKINPTFLIVNAVNQIVLNINTGTMRRRKVARSV